jgi:hypothetical protein
MQLGVASTGWPPLLFTSHDLTERLTLWHASQVKVPMLDLRLEYAPVGFTNARFSGKIAPELISLAQRRVARKFDIVFA